MNTIRNFFRDNAQNKRYKLTEYELESSTAVSTAILAQSDRQSNENKIFLTENQAAM